ncbi:class I SAM-dependent methyltransferase [Streptomyces sp. DT24]|uniref:class I SAM-dependent methyltransferase n=1 Tax=Streptomyces sp. DT24 TaxID=3416520 RepID=UPI003CF2FA76
MDDPESVSQYDQGGATGHYFRAVYDLNARALSALLPPGGSLLDFGTGSGRALQHLLRGRPDIKVTGIDLSPVMLAAARATGAGDSSFSSFGSVEFVEADITSLPPYIVDRPWDAVSCLWTLHQLPGTDMLVSALRQMETVRRHCGAALWILDFQRLRNPATMPALLDTLEPVYPPRLRADGIASEAAAFRHSELRAALTTAGLADMRSSTSRPLPHLQSFWAPPAPPFPSDRKAQRWQLEDLTGRARTDARLLHRRFGHPGAL